MKKRLLTLLMVVAMLAGMATIASAARIPEAEVELGDFSWVNGDNQMGWRNDVMYARENEDLGVQDITLTASQVFKATHLVLELAGAPAGGMQFVWQTNAIPGWAWYQKDLDLDVLDAMLDGTTLTVPLPYGFANYGDFISVVARTDSAAYEAEGGAYGAIKLDEEVDELEVKFLVAYWEEPVADFVLSAKLTYGPVGAAPAAMTFELPEIGGGSHAIGWCTQFAQAAGDGVPGVTLRKDVLSSAKGITLVVDAGVFTEGEDLTYTLQSMDAWWDSCEAFYTYTVDGDVGYIDLWLTAHTGDPGWDHFINPDNMHGKFGFESENLEAAFQSAYLWWTQPDRSPAAEEDPPPADDTPAPADDTPAPADDTPAPATPAPTPTPATTDDDGGIPVWVWIVIAVGVVVIVVIIVIVSRKKK